MNEKLEKLLDMFVTGLQKGAGLMQEELPKLAHEILEYAFYSELVKLILCSIILILTISTAIYLVKFKLKDDRDGYYWGFLVALILPLIISSVNVFTKTDNVIKIKVAPRVYLIDYIRTIK